MSEKQNSEASEQEKFDLITFEDEQPAPKKPKSDNRLFESYQKKSSSQDEELQNIHFIQDHSVVSSVEDYALRVRLDADEYASNVKGEADKYVRTKKMEIEQLSNELDSRKAKIDADILDLKEEYDKNYTKIYKVAHKEGYQDGKDEALVKAEDNIVRVADITREFVDMHKKILRKFENEILSLSLLIASKVLMKEIQEDPTFLAANLKMLTDELDEKGKIKIYMHPDDYEFMKAKEDFFSDKFTEGSFFGFELDEQLTPGNVNIETDFYYIDLDLNNRFESIRKDIYKIYFDRIAQEQNSGA